MAKPDQELPTEATITRAYPVRVMGMDDKIVDAGKDVALPVKKVRQLEARFGLKPAEEAK